MDRSLVKVYDMYKADEYIKNFSNNKKKYLKVLDKIPDDLRTELIRLDDKINRDNQIELTILLLCYVVLGGIVGFLFGINYVI